MIDKEKLHSFLMQRNVEANKKIEEKGNTNYISPYDLGQAQTTAELITKLDSGDFNEVVEKADITAVYVKNMDATLSKLAEDCVFLSTGISKYRAQTKLPDECMAAEKYTEMFEEAAGVYMLIEQLRLQDKWTFDSYYERELDRQNQLESETTK